MPEDLLQAMPAWREDLLLRNDPPTQVHDPVSIWRHACTAFLTAAACLWTALRLYAALLPSNSAARAEEDAGRQTRVKARHVPCCCSE